MELNSGEYTRRHTRVTPKLSNNSANTCPPSKWWKAKFSTNMMSPYSRIGFLSGCVHWLALWKKFKNSNVLLAPLRVLAYITPLSLYNKFKVSFGVCVFLIISLIQCCPSTESLYFGCTQFGYAKPQSRPKVVGTLELYRVSPFLPNQCWEISRFFQQKGKKPPDYQHWKWEEGRTEGLSERRISRMSHHSL